MTKHTLGEWCISPRRYQVDDNTVVISVRGWSEIALVLLDVQGSRSREEGWANARLIAAAPDLLEALQYAVKQVPELGSVPGIRAAIARATGVQP